MVFYGMVNATALVFEILGLIPKEKAMVRHANSR
jgi:hypothetical protein